MPIVFLVFSILAMLGILVYVVIRLNELEKEVGALKARVMGHYESR